MPSYAHNELLEDIRALDEVPADPALYSKWVEAGQHLDFLLSNAKANEIVIHASGPYTFVHSLVVPNSSLTPLDHDDLNQWSTNPYTSIASYVWGSHHEGVQIERGVQNSHSKTLDAGVDLVFGRTFEGWKGDERTYFEINQEYTHLAGIHWRPEEHAYCRFDRNGDLDQCVSITTSGVGSNQVSLISFDWEPLEEYLVASSSSLVRVFDYTLLRRSDFTRWPEGPEQKFFPSDNFFYRQKVNAGHSGYTRGVQIVGARLPASEVHNRLRGISGSAERNQYVEFIAHDWRNDRVCKISTDKKASTNYFDAHKNSLPYELSPAFFRPEVLSKYKTDREKYTIGEREIHCRSAWYLRGYDVNEAGQVHAYICYLRALPYSEQLHWQSFNEKPKGSISKRAVINDFKGEPTPFMNPLQKVLSTLRKWNDKAKWWWKLRDKALFDHVNTPLTTSRDEWGEAFLSLSKLVIEGLEVQALRARLKQEGIEFGPSEQSIVLLEKLLNEKSGNSERLEGLRMVQLIRTKAKGHASNSDAKQLAQDAIKKHGSFAGHFKFVCSLVSAELENIARRLD